MASASDSDDASDIFWPGYVDAVTNLAINLLFVVAILSIVVLTTNLQISMLEGKKKTSVVNQARSPGSDAVEAGKSQYMQAQQALKKALSELPKLKDSLGTPVFNADTSALTTKQLEAALKGLQAFGGASSLPANALTDAMAAEITKAVTAFEQLQKQLALSSPDIKKAVDSTQQLEKLLQNLDVMLQKQMAQPTNLDNAALAQDAAKAPSSDDKVEQLKRQLAQTQEMLKKEQALRATAVKAAEKANEAIGQADKSVGVVEEFNVQERTNKGVQGTNKLLDNRENGGLVVVFANDVIELSDAEVAELMRRLSNRGALKNGRWELRVISPKGFSEATRMAYYRLNSLRNVLLKSGVNSMNIDMRLLEAESGGNNARVLVRPVP